MKIEIKKNTKNKFYFHVIAANGKVMLRSRDYESRRNLAESLAVLRAGLPEAKVVDNA